MTIYKINPDNESSESYSPGTSVIVPLGKRKVNGIVLAETDEVEEGFKIKDIESVHHERPLLAPDHLKWVEWVARWLSTQKGPWSKSAASALRWFVRCSATW